MTTKHTPGPWHTSGRDVHGSETFETDEAHMKKLGENQRYVNDARIGARVELPCWSDQWMMGARFGTVKRIIATKTHYPSDSAVNDILCVQCDNPRIRRQYRHFEGNFKYL